MGKRVTLLALSLLVAVSGAATFTYAYFHDRDQNKPVFFRAMEITDFLAIAPGTAKATFPAAGIPKGETLPVATYGEQGIELNFGEVVEGSGKNFIDVLQLTNISPKTVVVSWKMQGEIAPLWETGQEDLPVDAGQTVPVNLKLDVEVGTPPGLYKGNLVITVDRNFLKLKIPARVTVRTKGKKYLEPARETTENSAYSPANSPQQGKAPNPTTENSTYAPAELLTGIPENSEASADPVNPGQFADSLPPLDTVSPGNAPMPLEGYPASRDELSK